METWKTDESGAPGHRYLEEDLPSDRSLQADISMPCMLH